jgi:hypothetical protein
MTPAAAVAIQLRGRCRQQSGRGAESARNNLEPVATLGSRVCHCRSKRRDGRKRAAGARCCKHRSGIKEPTLLLISGANACGNSRRSSGGTLNLVLVRIKRVERLESITGASKQHSRSRADGDRHTEDTRYSGGERDRA